MSYSTLAKKVQGVRNPSNARARKPWGYLIHTTGGGVTAKARKTGRKPIEVALEVYIASQNGSNGYFWGGPTYVCDLDGTLYQIAPDEAKTAHAGGPHRMSYLSGAWPLAKSSAGKILSATAVTAWRSAWPTFKSPYHLFPSTDPNEDYIGIEMIPIGDGFGGPPMAPGLRFSKAQHDACAALGADLGKRHQWPSGWQNANRLVGHEDVDPIERSDQYGGWDPGQNRSARYFDLSYVRTQIGTP